jgi:osmotically-inducible protein OsmY
VGSAEQVRPVTAPLRALGVEIVPAEDPASGLKQLRSATRAIVVIPPVGKRSTRNICLRLREGLGASTVPVLVVLRQPMLPREQGSLYWNGAAGVFDWPREKVSLLRIVARVILVGQAGRPLKGDEKLTRAARQRLRGHPASLGNALTVTVVRGVAVLEGQVDALWKLDEAEADLARLPGIEDVVVDGVEVSDSGLADRAIARSVRAVLEGAAGIDVSTLAVRVAQGKVTLSGEVADRREMQRLVGLVRHVRGVRAIENLVVISAGKKARDTRVARMLVDEIAHHLPRAKVTVSVFGGVAVLEGRVPHPADRRQLEQIAEQHRFVQRVVNKVEAARAKQV